MRIADLPSPDALTPLVGQEIAVSDWWEVTQERIQRFADATDDHQWIHLDAARAAADSPYGGTIAHGLLTLSLIVPMIYQAVRIGGVGMIVNYGFNKVRFPAAVPAGSRVRGRVAVAAVEPVRAGGGVQVTWTVTVEREGGDKPAVVAEWVARLT
jgi:acyl dehydratase